MPSRLLIALRRKYETPQEAIRALGLSPALIEPPRLAQDEGNGFRQLYGALVTRVKPEWKL